MQSFPHHAIRHRRPGRDAPPGRRCAAVARAARLHIHRLVGDLGNINIFLRPVRDERVGQLINHPHDVIFDDIPSSQKPIDTPTAVPDIRAPFAPVAPASIPGSPPPPPPPPPMKSAPLSTTKVLAKPDAAGAVNTGLGNVIASDAIKRCGLGWGGVISVVVAVALED
ncbi:hypothetical protein HK101_004461, partial [Irineochytrium annulatum]